MLEKLQTAISMAVMNNINQHPDNSNIVAFLIMAAVNLCWIYAAATTAVRTYDMFEDHDVSILNLLISWGLVGVLLFLAARF